MKGKKRQGGERRRSVLITCPTRWAPSIPSVRPSPPSWKRILAGDKSFPSLPAISQLLTSHRPPLHHSHLRRHPLLHPSTFISPPPPASSSVASSHPPPPPHSSSRTEPNQQQPASQMFLTDKYHALLPSHSADSNKNRRHHHPDKATSRTGPVVESSFDAALAARLRGLLPLPASPLGALARLADLLAITLSEAVPALAVGEGDASVAVAAHLDAGIALLDACNAIAARIDRLRRRRLLSRFAVHLLSSPPSSSSPSSIRRARAALADRDDRAAASTPAPLPSLPFDQPRGHQLTAAARVLLAVNAVSSLAGAAAASVLGTAGGPLLEAAFPLVSGDFPWAEPFNAVSCQLSGLDTAAATREVDAVDESVGKLALVLDNDETAVADASAALRAATQEVEERTEELTARLDRLSDAVNGVFRAALCLRNAELGCLMVGPAAAGKTRK